MKRACTATIAAAAAVALAAGMTSPASAEAGSTAERMAGGSAGGSAVQATSKHRITLITGDRVVVDAKGRVVGLERAKG
ncbi:hypothetical protein ACFFS2_12015, partial [Streptomyces aurantiacus]